MRVRFGGVWIAESEHAVLLFEPDRYPVAYFPEAAIAPEVLELTEHSTRHRDLGPTAWYTVRLGERRAPRAAWKHTELPAYANDLKAHVAFAWPAMDAFYEEDERILGHAADSYHRIDIRQALRNLVVRRHDRVVADTRRPLVLYESGFAPRWYVPRADVDETALTPVESNLLPLQGAVQLLRHRRCAFGGVVLPRSFFRGKDVSPAWYPSNWTSFRCISIGCSSVLSPVRP
ncbi:MAG: DUF427 domain-containing protein [Acidobacteriaceae bacterium]